MADLTTVFAGIRSQCGARYFAGGDCINGGREVVDAVADGKRAARAMALRLENKTEATHG